MSAAPAFAAGHELLDDPGADPVRVATSLGNIARANRWFGGSWAALHGIDQVLGDDPPRRVSLLDLGTGLGDLPRAAVVRAARRGIELRPYGLERHPAAARLARGAAFATVVGCVGALPVRPGSVDIVLVSQVLHHLDARSATALLASADQVARRGVVIADLRRSRVAPLLFRAGAGLLRFDRDTVADGITSISRGYTVDELRSLCAAAGAPASVEARPGYRVVAWWRTGKAASS
ncbi:MAG TPA: methyltransferase domain-containing protein [Gemmatimonadales bacterium]|nr:methyltransferase domain-containing protein [Gemmatimonadales bacterium]